MTDRILSDIGERALHAVNTAHVLAYGGQEHLIKSGGTAYVAPADTPAPTLHEDPSAVGWQQPAGFDMHIGVGAAQLVDTEALVRPMLGDPIPTRGGAALWALLMADYLPDTPDPHGKLDPILDSLVEPHALLFRGEPEFSNAPMLEGQVYAPHATFSQYLGTPWIADRTDQWTLEIVPVLFHAPSSRRLDDHRLGIVTAYVSPMPLRTERKRTTHRGWRILGKN